MPGVVVRYREKKPGTTNGLSQIKRVFKSSGERLVANYVNARLQKRFRRRIVEMVRGHDRDRVDAVFSARFGRSHFREAFVSAVWRNVQIERGSAGSSRIGRQRPCYQLKSVVKPCGNPVYCADEPARTATNHSKPQTSVCLSGALFCRCVNGHRSVLNLLSAISFQFWIRGVW